MSPKKALCVCAVLGVATTLISVVVSAVLFPSRVFQSTCTSIHHPVTPLTRGQTSVEIWRSETPLATFHWAWAITAATPPNPPFQIVEEPDPEMDPWLVPRLLRWGDGAAQWPEPSFQDMRGYVVTRGWPFRCFWHEYDFSNARPIARLPGNRMIPPTLAGAVELPEPLSVQRSLNRHGAWPIGIPLRPLWAGLAFNLLILSTAWWIVLVVPLTLKDYVLGALRRRRGLCPACAYDLRATPPGNPCPECGHKPRHRTPASPL